MKFAVAVLGAAVGMLVLLTGCAGASNTGGATTCGDFLAMRTEDMDATVARMLKERNGRNASSSDVIDTRVKVLAACEPADKADAKIGDLA